MEGCGVEGSIEHNGELLKEYIPCIGMEFESEETAFQFYNEYRKIKGFSIRKDYETRSRKDGMTINRKFVCSKEGVKEKDKRNQTVIQPRRETRIGCKAFMYVSIKRDTSKWIVTKFNDIHNHMLHLPETAHMMSSQRRLCESQGINAEIAEATGLPLKLSHDLISAQAGGREFVGFMRDDLKSYLRLDIDEMITNIFWADHQMITDYGLFGDTLSFDTTFRTNKEYRPLALFTSFNHFRMTVIFGAALMYDETTPSFVWLFETFLKAMSGKKPFSFFTDQDQAMANPLSQVRPDVKRGLYTFHLNQNAMKHLGYLFGGSSTFGSDFNACMFDYEEETELIQAWNLLIEKFNLEDNSWMKKTWDLREKWAHVYMKWSYTAGMRSTQLSESLNAKLKKHFKSDLNLVQFFTYFNQIVIEKWYNEKEVTHDSREKLVRIKFSCCPMLLHIAKFYTPLLFDLFHKEFDISLDCKVKKYHELGEEIRFVKCKHGEEREYVVLGNIEFDESGDKICGEICCSCRKLESFEILCGHAIKVLSQMNVMEIPEKYILGR